MSSPTTDKDDSGGAVLSSKKKPKICILGGGFGGLYTAVKLDGLMWPNGFKPEVTLIDQSDRFVFKPLLYEILMGVADEFEVAPYFTDLLEPFQTRFVQGHVVGVDVSPEAEEGGTVRLSDGGEILFDWLVIAIGAKTNFYGIPGVMDYATPFYTIDDAHAVESALTELSQEQDKKSAAVVVGGGYAGVELADALVTKLQQLKSDQTGVTLITDTESILPMAPSSQRHAAELELKRRGVEIKTGFFVKTIEAKNGSKWIALTPASGENGQEATQMEADLVTWTAGSKPATSEIVLSQDFPFERTRFGSLRTEPTLKLVKQRRVFACGDDACIEDPGSNGDRSRFPATAQVALQQADYVAWNLWAAINNRPLLPFRYQHLGDMMSLGAQNAAIALPFELPKSVNDAIRNSPLASVATFVGFELGEGDTPRDQRVTMEGPIAAFLRRIAYWYRQPTNEQKAKIAQRYFEKVAQVIAARSRTAESN